MTPKRAVTKRSPQRTGATRRAAELVEAARVAADAERAAALAAHLEAESVAFAEAQRIALEEAAKHDAELRCEAAGHEARRAAAALDTVPKGRGKQAHRRSKKNSAAGRQHSVGKQRSQRAEQR